MIQGIATKIESENRSEYWSLRAGRDLEKTVGLIKAADPVAPSEDCKAFALHFMNGNGE